MLKNLFRSQLRINMVSGVVVTVINAVAMMVAFPIYLHFLGYERYGVWLVLATVLSFAQLGNLGIGQAVMKLVAEEHGRDDIEGIQRYVTTALALLCLSGSLVLIAVLVFKTQIISAFRLSDDNAQTALWLLPYIGILSIYVFIVQALNATLSGLGRMDLANYAQSLGRIVAVTAAAALLYSGRGIESLLIGNTLSYVFIHVMSLICIWRITHIRLLRLRNLDAQRGKRILRFGGTIFGGSLIGMLFSPFNKLMLSRYAGVSSIPVYEIAFRGSMQVRGLVQAGLRALMPEISRISGNMTRYAKDRISQIYHRAMKVIFLFGIPMYGVLIIFAPLLLRVWLGERFVETLPGAFRIMLIGTFLSLLGVPAYYTLMGMGRVRYTLGAHVILSGVSFLIVVTNVFICHSISVERISWAILTATAVSTLYLNRQNKRRILYGLARSAVCKKKTRRSSMVRKCVRKKKTMAKPREYYQSDRYSIVEFLPKTYNRVLDVGCAEGRFATNLNPSAEIWGVEMDPCSADIAKTRMKKVLVGSYMNVADQLPNDYFDLVICNDVIEHMQDHTMFLETIKKKIVNGGCIIGSIPNVRYIYNLYNLLVKRDWKYGESGIIDSTHLRFFTEKSLKREMLEKEYIIEVFKGINPFRYSTNMLKRITKKILWGGLLLFTFGTFKDTRYVQFGFRITPKNSQKGCNVSRAFT